MSVVRHCTVSLRLVNMERIDKGEYYYRPAKQKAYSVSSPFVFRTLPRLAALIIG